MKNLLACLAMLAAFGAGAQTNGPEYPYNPDIEPDGYIGINDLLALLPIFGQEFEVVTVDSDTSSALVFTGSLPYMHCLKSCQSLGSEWQLLDEEAALVHWDSLIITEAVPSKQAWMESTRDDLYRNTLRTGLDNPNSIYLGSIDDAQTQYNHDCWCVAKVRPEIEYQVVFGTDIGAINTNVQLALQEGWIPLGSVSCSGTADCYQAMWRYAE